MVTLKKRFAVNVLMNWAATAVSMVVPFFLTPFVVRHLGSVGYGVWILAVSTVSYLYLLDLGLKSAVIRFVSKAQARELLDEASETVSAALWIRLLIAALVATIGVLLAIVTPHLFKIPAEFSRAAQITVLLCSFGMAVTLVAGVFGAVLSATNRFDLLSAITMTQTVFRALGVLFLLHRGRGLISLACWELLVLVVAGLATTLIALKVFPPARTRIRRPPRSVLSAIGSYSFTTFVFMVAIQIIMNTDSMVVGAFLSVGMVTFFSIGSSLVMYTSQVSSAVSTMFTPMASAMEASGRSEELQRLLIRGTQGMLGLVAPIAFALIFRGRTFITLWMGPEYGLISETVLRILMISLFFSMANGTPGAIMMAIDKHKPVARSAVFEAAFNLGLSIVLVKTIGLYGVAWGTSISMGITHLVFWPRYIRKVLNVPVRTLLWEGWFKVILCALPFALVSAVADKFWHPANLVTFFAQVVVTLPVYGLCVLAAFRSEARGAFQHWKTSRLVPA